MVEDTSAVLAVNAPAKVNLYLHVTGKRADGYHTLDSLVALGGIHDRITAAPAHDLSLVVEGPFADVTPAGDDNIVLHAARKLQGMLGVGMGARLTLTKRLPVAGGIGGGSADAAGTLRLLTNLWGARPTEAELVHLARELGADVPVCLAGRAAYMGGIGEELTPVPELPKAWILLVNPNEQLSTKAVFDRFAGPYSEPARLTTAPTTPGQLAAELIKRKNDLTETAVSIVPAVGRVLETLEALPGCLMARMSGSGATCFGLFADPAGVTQAALQLVKERPAWWAKPASLEWDASALNI